MSMMRLDKYLANAGIGTRSQVKEFIKKGEVSINYQIVKKGEVKVNPEIDCITFHNQIIQNSTYSYYVLNKPSGYVSATIDNTAPTVLSLIKEPTKDLFPAGRLDKDTEGLLLITNDGELSHKLLSPKRHVDKVYYAKIDGFITEDDISVFAKGIEIGDEDLKTTLPAKLTVLQTESEEKNYSYIEVTIHEGKFHQVKRMFQAIGKKVLYLKRIQFGPLVLPPELPIGEYRSLTPEELQALKNCVSSL